MNILVAANILKTIFCFYVKIAESLEVEVFELFKTDIVSPDNDEMITRLSEDIAKNVNSAMAEVFKQYLG
ncbi:MAG: hypothetical protein LBG73_03540 [Spirochaetaceae bacterium]|nr:hypothetical protein [Spirochaetaceae bacterium]